VKKFGAYLQIHSCLVSSAKVEADKAIDHLLDLARFDPSHREARKELAKASAMTFYESVSGGSGVIGGSSAQELLTLEPFIRRNCRLSSSSLETSEMIALRIATQ